jgi:hypothetical protein
LILVNIAVEEGESSSKVVVLRTEVVIKKVKDNNRDIKITLNNNIIIKRLIKVIPPLKFNRDPNKLKEYLNKTQIYINYTTNRFKKEY